MASPYLLKEKGRAGMPQLALAEQYPASLWRQEDSSLTILLQETAL